MPLSGIRQSSLKVQSFRSDIETMQETPPGLRPIRSLRTHPPLVQVTARLLAINRVISRLDASIRAAAFQILAPYYFDSADSGSALEEDMPGTTRADGRKRGIRDVTPGDNVLACVALLYAQRGESPITEEDVRRIASRCGLRIPRSPNNTLRYARRQGKAMFRFKGSGWNITPVGASYLRLVYGVRPPARPPGAKRAA